MSKWNTIIRTIREEGMMSLLKKIRVRYPLYHEKIRGFKKYYEEFSGKSGLEIGGPSPVFQNKGFVPLYKIIGNLDGCNFSTFTIWEGNISNNGFIKRTSYAAEYSEIHG